jgi:RimJ/RimL family protein N-acetyltransferase
MLIKKDELTIRTLTPDDAYMQLVLEINGAPAGEMNCHKMNCKTMQISIEIEPSLRNKGYGTRFLRMLLDELFSTGSERIILDVDLDNHIARHVYEKLGFRIKQIKHEIRVADYELLSERK